MTRAPNGSTGFSHLSRGQLRRAVGLLMKPLITSSLIICSIGGVNRVGEGLWRARGRCPTLANLAHVPLSLRSSVISLRWAGLVCVCVCVCVCAIVLSLGVCSDSFLFSLGNAESAQVSVLNYLFRPKESFLLSPPLSLR